VATPRGVGLQDAPCPADYRWSRSAASPSQALFLCFAMSWRTAGTSSIGTSIAVCVVCQGPACQVHRWFGQAGPPPGDVQIRRTERCTTTRWSRAELQGGVVQNRALVRPSRSTRRVADQGAWTTPTCVGRSDSRPAAVATLPSRELWGGCGQVAVWETPLLPIAGSFPCRVSCPRPLHGVDRQGAIFGARSLIEAGFQKSDAIGSPWRRADESGRPGTPGQTGSVRLPTRWRTCALDRVGGSVRRSRAVVASGALPQGELMASSSGSPEGCGTSLPPSRSRGHRGATGPWPRWPSARRGTAAATPPAPGWS